MHEEDDLIRRIQAEQSLLHVQDLTRQIGPREVEAHASTEPIRKREVQNNFLKEAVRLLEQRRGK
jgi:hypothetical protein